MPELHCSSVEYGLGICLALSQLCLANTIHVFHDLCPYFLTWTVLYCTLKNKCLEYLCPLYTYYEKHIVPHSESCGWFLPGALLVAQQHITSWKLYSGKTANFLLEKNEFFIALMFLREIELRRGSDFLVAKGWHFCFISSELCRHLLSSSTSTIKLACRSRFSYEHACTF